MTKIAVPIECDGSYCFGCRFVPAHGLTCPIYNAELKWGGDHVCQMVRCSQCLEAEVSDD